MDDLIWAFVDMRRAAEDAKAAIQALEGFSPPELLEEIAKSLRLIGSMAESFQDFFDDLRVNGEAIIDITRPMETDGYEPVVVEAGA